MIVVALEDTAVVDHTCDRHTQHIEHRDDEGAEAHHDNPLGQRRAPHATEGNHHE